MSCDSGFLFVSFAGYVLVLCLPLGVIGRLCSVILTFFYVIGRLCSAIVVSF